MPQQHCVMSLDIMEIQTSSLTQDFVRLRDKIYVRRLIIECASWEIMQWYNGEGYLRESEYWVDRSHHKVFFWYGQLVTVRGSNAISFQESDIHLHYIFLEHLYLKAFFLFPFTLYLIKCISVQKWWNQENLWGKLSEEKFGPRSS